MPPCISRLFRSSSPGTPVAAARSERIRLPIAPLRKTKPWCFMSLLVTTVFVLGPTCPLRVCPSFRAVASMLRSAGASSDVIGGLNCSHTGMSRAQGSRQKTRADIFDRLKILRVEPGLRPARGPCREPNCKARPIVMTLASREP